MEDQQYLDINSKLEEFTRIPEKTHQDGNRRIVEIGLSGFEHRYDIKDAKEMLSYRDAYLTFLINQRDSQKRNNKEFDIEAAHQAFVLSHINCKLNRLRRAVKDFAISIGATLFGVGVLEFRFLLENSQPDKFLLVVCLVGFVASVVGLAMPDYIEPKMRDS